MKASGKSPVWDLKFLYSSYKDPKIEKDIKKALQSSLQFKKEFSNKVEKLVSNPKLLLSAIKKYEDICTKASLPSSYIGNVHNVDMNNNELTALLSKIEIDLSCIFRNLSFFENSLSRISSTKIKSLLRSNQLKAYHNWLKKIFSMKPHLLSKELEELIIEKDINGTNSWKNFRSIYESKYSIPFKGPGDPKKRPYTLVELTKFAEHPKRELRQNAVRTYLEKFKEDSYIYAHIYNSIIQDMILIEKNRRSFSPLISVRNLKSQLDNDVVKTMHKVITTNYSTAQRYWKLKAKILGIKDFNNADIRTPYRSKNLKNRNYSYDSAMRLLQETYDTFHKSYGDVFKKMYRQKLVHASILKGKRSGAYCSFLPSPHPPLVLLNYMGTIEDVSTAAHEAGHWIHGYLMSKRQSIVNMEIPMATAETASVFNETLLTEKLLEEIKNKEELKSLLISKLDGIMATVFRQTAFSIFEQEAFSLSEKGPLSPEEFSKVFIGIYKKLFGKSVKTTRNFEYEWARIPHFMNPFYVYAYAFGELATISLYKKYNSNKGSFPKKYMEFLSLGSSMTPFELFLSIDINIKSKTTWENSISYIDNLIDRLEKLVN